MHELALLCIIYVFTTAFRPSVTFSRKTANRIVNDVNVFFTDFRLSVPFFLENC